MEKKLVSVATLKAREKALKQKREAESAKIEAEWKANKPERDKEDIEEYLKKCQELVECYNNSCKNFTLWGFPEPNDTVAKAVVKKLKALGYKAKVLEFQAENGYYDVGVDGPLFIPTGGTHSKYKLEVNWN